jgi:hypothetical protein
VVNFIHLVFRQTQELNSHPRSPRRSPLDQGASPVVQDLKSLGNTGTRVVWCKGCWKKNNCCISSEAEKFTIFYFCFGFAQSMRRIGIFWNPLEFWNNDKIHILSPPLN